MKSGNYKHEEEAEEVVTKKRKSKPRLADCFFGKKVHLDRITNEENRSVVSNHVPVSFFGVELHRKAARVSLGIGRALLTTNGRESREDRRSFANTIEKLCLAIPV